MSSKKYNRARKRVLVRKSFYYHLAVYLAVGLFLIALNAIVNPWFIWVPIPLLAWGLILFFHYLAAVGIPFLNLDKDWEEREIERELQKMDRQTPAPFSEEPAPLEEEEKLELKEFKKLRKEWDDQEFV